MASRLGVATPPAFTYKRVMTRRRRILAGSALVVALGAVGAWYELVHKVPPPAKPVDERSYDQIDRADYEAWMQDLGYTE